MSTPVNPLDKYRSFSYHHMLVVSNNSEDIRKFSSSDDNLLATKIHQTKLGDPINVGGAKNTYLVIDTAKISQFSIKDLSYVGYLGVGSLSQTQVLGSEVLMTVIDESSIGFMNYLRYLIDDKLKTDINGLVFLLKTFFIGHTFDDKTVSMFTSTIPLILVNLELDLGSQSFGIGTYSLRFIPLNNGAPMAAGTNNLMYDVSSLVAENGKLKDILKNFQDQINKRSREWFYNYQTKISSEGRIEDNKSNVGRLVQVRITVPKEWEDFQIDGIKSKLVEIEHTAKKKVDEEKQKFEKKQQEEYSKTGKVPTEVYKAITPNMSIYDVITEVLTKSQKVVDMHSYDNAKKGQVKTFKILSTMTSDENSVLMHYNVLEVPVPDVDQAKQQDQTLKQKYFTKVGNQEIPKNGIIFDYIHTGKNVDILAFNVSIKNGFIGLMNDVEMGAEALEDKNIVIKDQAKDPKDVDTKKQSNVERIRDKQPLTLPVRSSEEKKNFASTTTGDKVDIKAKQEMLTILSDLHGMTNLDTKMTIRGNSDLMFKTIRQTIPPHIEISTTLSGTSKEKFINDVKISDSGTAYDTEFLNSVMNDSTRPDGEKQYDVATLPLFAKVNIYGPAIDNFGNSALDVSRIKGSPLEAYAKQYWYTGWYLVREIHHRFSEGRFEQDLAMHAFEVYQKHSYTQKVS